MKLRSLLEKVNGDEEKRLWKTESHQHEDEMSELGSPLLFRYWRRNQQTEFPVLAIPSLNMFQRPLRHEVTEEIHFKIPVPFEEELTF